MELVRRVFGRQPRAWLASIPLFVLGSLDSARAAAWTEGFETSPVGEIARWRLVAGAEESWQARVTSDGAAVGSRCLELAVPDGRGVRGALAVYRQDATPYRGQTVRLTAQVRYRPDPKSNGWAQLMIGAARRDRAVLANDMGGDRPVSSTEWTPVSVALFVPPQADTLTVGLSVDGGGSASIDDLHLEVAAIDLSRWNRPPAPVSARGLENLVALARLYGYVRFFHPSDEAFAADWFRVVLDAVGPVEPAANASALRDRLQDVFAPLAPTLALATGALPALDPATLLPPGGSEREFTYWQHDGYGIDQASTNIYSSRRIERKALEFGRAAKGAPAPGAVTAGDLGGGVTFRLPVALHTQKGATWPRATATRTPSEIPEEWRPNGADRATRIAGVIIAWNVFQHFYPYFDIVPVDWDAELRTALQAAAADPDVRSYLRTLRCLTAALQDGHIRVTNSFDEEPYILSIVWDWAEGALVVTEARAVEGQDAPCRGDVVEALAGTRIGDLVARERPEISAATTGWANRRLLGNLRRRASDDPVRVTLRDPQGRTRDVEVTPVIGDHKPPRETRPEQGSEIAPGIAYFDLNDADSEALEAALPRLSQARGVVLDMRGYPGRAGYEVLRYLTRERITSAHWNVPLIFLPNRQGLAFETSGRWKIEPAKPHLPAPDGKIVFVTDGRAISYAESCMGIVEAYHLGTIVGDVTAGTNGNVAMIRLPGGVRISFTAMQVIKHDGTPHHGIGIHPTVPATRTIRGIADGRDEVLEKAIAAAGG